MSYYYRNYVENWHAGNFSTVLKGKYLNFVLELNVHSIDILLTLITIWLVWNFQRNEFYIILACGEYLTTKSKQTKALSI